MLADRDESLAHLRARLRELEHAARPTEQPPISTGFSALDAILPAGGLRPGTLVEWLAEAPGCGAGSLAVAAAVQVDRTGRTVVVVDGQEEFYPPGAADQGLDLDRTLLVRTRSARDELWAIDQVLRCRGVGAVLAWPERCDQRTLRRWQLAIEQCGGLGLLVRPERVRDEPCWADLRLRVATLPVELPDSQPASSVGRRLRVELLHGRGAMAGGTVELELNHETNSLHRPGAKPKDGNRRHAG
ncbi:MAG TPA: hypothetical protein VHZ24_09990 [Pirellulales bacterium]|jgi:hypothetical protein|nr:hypothetical protein [Pirellulales bacterium]